MLSSALSCHRMGLLQSALALVGMLAFVVYARSWKDATHLVYDVPASFAVFAFIAQLLLEWTKDAATLYWTARMGLLVVITVATVGREFLNWNISGHLTCVLAVALVQAVDPRLSFNERVLYLVPLPIVLAIRWWEFDGEDHWQTYNALIVGGSAAFLVMLAAPSK